MEQESDLPVLFVRVPMAAKELVILCGLRNLLQKLLRRGIHCAVVEVEGLSCMEAIQTGLVPVIAEGRLTATSQFALSPESVYPERSAKKLAERIDYWLSDDDRRRKEAERYRGAGARYDIRKSIEELRQMYRDAVAM